MKTCGYCGRANDAAAETCGGCGTALPADTLAPQPGALSCPACGASGDFKPAVELRGSFNWLAFLAGGILAVMFRNAGRGKKVQCNKCETLFTISSPASKTSRVIFWLLVTPTIIILIVLLIDFIRSIFSH